jgi:hypothetical protein
MNYHSNVSIGIWIPVGHVIKFYDTRRALWRIWSRTNWYLYPDRYTKMIPYYLYLHLWSITSPDFKQDCLKSDKMLKFKLSVTTCFYNRYLWGDRYALLVTVLCRKQSANLGWFRRLHQTSAVWHYLICVSALHLWYGCRRFTASDKHNALVVL